MRAVISISHICIYILIKSEMKVADLAGGEISSFTASCGHEGIVSLEL